MKFDCLETLKKYNKSWDEMTQALFQLNQTTCAYEFPEDVELIYISLYFSPVARTVNGDSFVSL